VKCIAVDTTCLFHLLLSGYFTFLIYVVALLLAFHVMFDSLRHRCRPACVFWWPSKFEMAQRVSDKSYISEQNVVVCIVPPYIMCDELHGLWPRGQGHTILNWEHLVCRFCCVHSSEVLWGELYIFYIPKVFFLVEVKFEVCEPVWVRIEIRTIWSGV